MGLQCVSNTPRFTRQQASIPDDSSGQQSVINQAVVARSAQCADPSTSDQLIASDNLARQQFLGNCCQGNGEQTSIEISADNEVVRNRSIGAASNPTVTTGLGVEVDSLINNSPLISRDIRRLQNEGYTIEYGDPGAGSFVDRDQQRIVIDPNTPSTEAVARSLAHEVGHAVHEPNFVGTDGLSRADYVEHNTRESLRDEANAILYQLEVRNEILAAGAPDIGVSGAQSAQYIRIAESGLLDQPAGREQAIEQIANLFARGERPSTQ